MTPLLTKADFRRWRSCPRKLFHGQRDYASIEDDDPFQAVLAEDGKAVGRLARTLFPAGILIDDPNPATAEKVTRA